MGFRFAQVKWSPVEVRYLKLHKKDPVRQLCIELAKSENAVKKKLRSLGNIVSGDAVLSDGPVKNKRSFIGRRKDCNNISFRSRWESNFFRYLRDIIRPSQILYEPQTFTFTQFGITHGTITYTPDFKVVKPDGSYYWVEIKGYLDKQDATKLRRFKKYFPNEFALLVGLPGNKNTKAAKFFLDLGVGEIWYYKDIEREYSKKIEGWE